VLEGRHGGLVGTRTLEEENGHVCYMGMIIGLCLVFGFLCLLLQVVDVVEGIPLRTCC
jgi:hypothetical protein